LLKARTLILDGHILVVCPSCRQHIDVTEQQESRGGLPPCDKSNTVLLAGEPVSCGLRLGHHGPCRLQWNNLTLLLQANAEAAEALNNARALLSEQDAEIERLRRGKYP
jgi:hypothetical protein